MINLFKKSDKVPYEAQDFQPDAIELENHEPPVSMHFAWFVIIAALLFLIVLYGLFAWFGMKISLNSTSRLGMLLGFGLTCFITMQAIINISVISGAAPTKGMPAPFISYGGSNMMVCLIAVGLLLSIAEETASPGYTERNMLKLRELWKWIKVW